MAGLLDFLQTPAGQGLLAAGLGAAASYGHGRGLLGNAGTGGLLGLQAYTGAQEQQARLGQQAKENEVRDLQITKAKTDLQDQQLARDTAKQFYQSGVPAVMGDSQLPPDLQTGAVPMPARAPSFDMKGYVQARMAQNPLEGMKLLADMQKDTPFNKVDPQNFTADSLARFSQTRNYADLVPRTKVEITPSGVAIDPYSTKPGSVFADPNKPFAMGPNGIVPNTAYQQFALSKAKAGANNVNLAVNTEKSLLTNVAGGLAKNMTAAQDAARSSLGTIATVNRLTEALDSGNVIAGPGASFRQYGLQVGNALGVAGKDSQEKLLNTRQAIQSLAQLELDAAQQMKGQGQITEAERGIIRRAASGDIDSMTAPELRLLGGVLDRTARTKIRNYNQQVKPLLSDPNAAPIAPFLTVEEPPARQAASGGVRRYNPATGKIE